MFKLSQKFIAIRGGAKPSWKYCLLILLAFFIAISSNIEILAANDALIKQKKIYNTGLMYSYNVESCQSSSSKSKGLEDITPGSGVAGLVDALGQFAYDAGKCFDWPGFWLAAFGVKVAESGWAFDSALVQETNNIMSIKCSPAGSSGKYYSNCVDAGGSNPGPWRSYDSPQDSFKDLALLWKTSDHYSTIANIKDDSIKIATDPVSTKNYLCGPAAESCDMTQYNKNKINAMSQIKTYVEENNLEEKWEKESTAERGACLKDLNNGSSSSSSSSSESSGGRPTKVFLDPGHTGGPSTAAAAETTGPAAGLINNDYSNGQEDKDVWYVATEVEKRLEEDGYEVIMSRSESEASSLTAKGNKANEAKADIGVSIHTSQGLARYGVGYDVVGNFRQNTSDGKRITFDNGDVASKSAEYSKKIASARTDAEGREVVASGDMSGSFPQGRGLPSWGNTAVIMLAAQDVPWAYNEFDRAGSALTDQEKQQYIDGLYNGIKDAVPATMNGGECSNSSSGGNGDITATAIELAWPDRNHKQETKPEYATALKEVDLYNVVLPPGASCDVYVATVMRYSGVDPDFYCCKAHLVQNYLVNSPKYKEIDNLGNSDNLQSGDILSTSGHVAMAIKKDGQWMTASASNTDRTGDIVPGLEYSSSGEQYRIFRFVGDN